MGAHRLLLLLLLRLAPPVLLLLVHLLVQPLQRPLVRLLELLGALPLPRRPRVLLLLRRPQVLLPLRLLLVDQLLQRPLVQQLLRLLLLVLLLLQRTLVWLLEPLGALSPPPQLLRLLPLLLPLPLRAACAAGLGAAPLRHSVRT